MNNSYIIEKKSTTSLRLSRLYSFEKGIPWHKKLSLLFCLIFLDCNKIIVRFCSPHFLSPQQNKDNYVTVILVKNKIF